MNERLDLVLNKTEIYKVAFVSGILIGVGTTVVDILTDEAVKYFLKKRKEKVDKNEKKK